jgi:hypothetical protein
MGDETAYNLSQGVGGLKPKDKTPKSGHILDGWIARAERDLHSDGGRLGWLIASTVAVAALQHAFDGPSEPAFLLKGGSLLQHKFRAPTRTTTDVDGLVRGDIQAFLDGLDSLLAHPWGPFTFQRGAIEIIDVPHKLVKPRRFQLLIMLNGQTWRRVQVELSPDEGSAGHVSEDTPAPTDKAAQSAGLDIAPDDAVDQVNAWLDEIDKA